MYHIWKLALSASFYPIYPCIPLANNPENVFLTRIIAFAVLSAEGENTESYLVLIYPMLAIILQSNVFLGLALIKMKIIGSL